jgi:hypothetical protein
LVLEPLATMMVVVVVVKPAPRTHSIPVAHVPVVVPRVVDPCAVPVRMPVRVVHTVLGNDRLPLQDGPDQRRCLPSSRESSHLIKNPPRPRGLSSPRRTEAARVQGCLGGPALRESMAQPMTHLSCQIVARCPAHLRTRPATVTAADDPCLSRAFPLSSTIQSLPHRHYHHQFRELHAATQRKKQARLSSRDQPPRSSRACTGKNRRRGCRPAPGLLLRRQRATRASERTPRSQPRRSSRCGIGRPRPQCSPVKRCNSFSLAGVYINMARTMFTSYKSTFSLASSCSCRAFAGATRSFAGTCTPSFCRKRSQTSVEVGRCGWERDTQGYQEGGLRASTFRNTSQS